MDNQKRVDKILEAVEGRVQEEVGSLLGVDFVLADSNRVPVTKEEAFDDLLGKQICAKIDIDGEIKGRGCLLMGIKDAIRLGGTLIMLPSSELEEVIGREEYSEEIEDSYGEIANIIAGSFSKDFEEMYPKPCRFIRKEQAVLVPAKVEVESEEPVENQIYYRIVSTMAIDGKQMGNLTMLLPAVTFDLQWEGVDVGTEGVATEDNVSSPESQAGSKAAVSPEEKDNGQGSGDPSKAVAKVDFAKQKKRIDKILAECQERLSSEMSSLLGVEVKLSDQKNLFIDKEEFFFDHTTGKQVISDLEVVGDVEAVSYFSIRLKDAIHLGGVLIMLPPAELETVIAEEDFGEDNQDAYGEVANIIAGVYTAVFEEQYNQNLRFIRKDLHEVAPMKVDVDSEIPFPAGKFYVSTMTLVVDGTQLGEVHMLFPVDLLQLDDREAGKDQNVEDEEQENRQQKVKNSSASTPAPGGQASGVSSPSFDVEKHKKRVDKLLEASRAKIAEEVSAMLAAEVDLLNMENKIISKEDFFFDEVSGKQVLTNFDIVGELEGKSYLSVNIKDAVRIGGVLIMLPASELETVVSEEQFGGDNEDAFGEIANIISGVYTAIFEEGYSKNIRFVKSELTEVVPMKVDVDSNEPIENQDYYLSSMDLVIGGKGLGKVHFLLPSDLLQLGSLNEQEAEVSDNTAVAEVASESDEKQKSEAVTTGGGDGPRRGLDILLVGDDRDEIAKLVTTLEGMGYAAKSISFKDDVHGYIPGELKAVYLVMQEVNEMAFGVAIKISSGCSLPLIAAGPGWTRSKVIKAIKYGVRDILLTPASEEDIKENVANNLMKMAA